MSINPENKNYIGKATERVDAYEKATGKGLFASDYYKFIPDLLHIRVLFTDGKAPYLVSGPWALADVKGAGIDYQISQIPGFADIEGSTARPFVGVNCFFVASKGKNKAFAVDFVADAAKDSTFAEAMFTSNELPPAQKDLAEKLKTEHADMVTLADLAANADPMPGRQIGRASCRERV